LLSLVKRRPAPAEPEGEAQRRLEAARRRLKESIPPRKDG
jgi:hypothetical protein